MADSFFTGPDDFILIFNSTDSNVIHHLDGSFSFILPKNLEFTSIWEVAIIQLIIKSPLILDKCKLHFSSPENHDESKLDKTVHLNKTNFTSPENLIAYINEAIPQSMKSYIDFSLDTNGYIDLTIKNTKINIESDNLSEILGLKTRTYSNLILKQFS